MNADWNEATQFVCGASGNEEALSTHNQTITDAINASGRHYLTSATLKSQKIIRVSVGAQPTELKHVEKLWEALQVCAATY